MLLFCKKNNAEVSTYSVLTPTFIIEPFLRRLFLYLYLYYTRYHIEENGKEGYKNFNQRNGKHILVRFSMR